jgi:hypothetical protein
MSPLPPNLSLVLFADMVGVVVLTVLALYLVRIFCRLLKKR